MSDPVLLVRLEVGRFALPLRWVCEVLPFARLRLSPGAPAHCLGMLNLRGELLPVLEPILWLHTTARPRDVDDRIVICQIAELRLGFAVDEVGEVRGLATEDVQPLPPDLSTIDWASGLFTEPGDQEIYVLVNLETLLRSADPRGLADGQGSTVPEGQA